MVDQQASLQNVGQFWQPCPSAGQSGVQAISRDGAQNFHVLHQVGFGRLRQPTERVRQSF